MEMEFQLAVERATSGKLVESATAHDANPITENRVAENMFKQRNVHGPHLAHTADKTERPVGKPSGMPTSLHHC